MSINHISIESQIVNKKIKKLDIYSLELEHKVKTFILVFFF